MYLRGVQIHRRDGGSILSCRTYTTSHWTCEGDTGFKSYGDISLYSEICFPVLTRCGLEKETASSWWWWWWWCMSMVTTHVPLMEPLGRQGKVQHGALISEISLSASVLLTRKDDRRVKCLRVYTLRKVHGFQSRSCYGFNRRRGASYSIRLNRTRPSET